MCAKGSDISSTHILTSSCNCSCTNTLWAAQSALDCNAVQAEGSSLEPPAQFWKVKVATAIVFGHIAQEDQHGVTSLFASWHSRKCARLRKGWPASVRDRNRRDCNESCQARGRHRRTSCAAPHGYPCEACSTLVAQIQAPCCKAIIVLPHFELTVANWPELFVGFGQHNVSRVPKGDMHTSTPRHLTRPRNWSGKYRTS